MFAEATSIKQDPTTELSENQDSLQCAKRILCFISNTVPSSHYFTFLKLVQDYDCHKDQLCFRNQSLALFSGMGHISIQILVRLSQFFHESHRYQTCEIIYAALFTIPFIQRLQLVSATKTQEIGEYITKIKYESGI